MDWLNYLKYLLLGFIQGLTEPLPISSSAHVIFLANILKVNSINLDFEIIIHFASTLAILCYFRNDLITLIKNFFKKETNSSLNRQYGWCLIISSIPIGIFGLILKDYIDTYFTKVFITSIMMFITSLLLFYLGFITKEKAKPSVKLTYKSSFLIGLLQTVSLLPGISRSATTIFGGVTNGLNLKDSLRFSFFLYLIVSTGSFILSLSDLNIQTLFNGPILIAFIFAFIATLISVKWFFNKLNSKLCFFFSIYCFILAFITLIRL